MNNLRAAAFNDEHTGFEVRAALGKMQKEYLLEMDDAVVVTKDANGQVKLPRAANLTSVGALSGSVTS